MISTVSTTASSENGARHFTEANVSRGVCGCEADATVARGVMRQDRFTCVCSGGRCGDMRTWVWEYHTGWLGARMRGCVISYGPKEVSHFSNLPPWHVPVSMHSFAYCLSICVPGNLGLEYSSRVASDPTQWHRSFFCRQHTICGKRSFCGKLRSTESNAFQSRVNSHAQRLSNLSWVVIINHVGPFRDRFFYKQSFNSYYFLES